MLAPDARCLELSHYLLSVYGLAEWKSYLIPSAAGNVWIFTHYKCMFRSLQTPLIVSSQANRKGIRSICVFLKLSCCFVFFSFLFTVKCIQCVIWKSCKTYWEYFCICIWNMKRANCENVSTLYFEPVLFV